MGKRVETFKGTQRAGCLTGAADAETVVAADDGSVKANGWALLPFGVFAVFYAGLSLYAGNRGFEMSWYKVPMPIAFLVASAVAFVSGRRRTLMEKVDTYAKGMGETNIMIMCLIFILAGAFATIAKGSGAVDAAVALAQTVIPARLMVAGIFLVACLISTAIGTSCGTIAAVTPIALGFADPLGLPPALLMGSVVAGAMFGDNLSMISDTTIAATRTQGVRMRDKFLANIRIAAPAALGAFALYAVAGSAAVAVAAPSVGWREFLLVMPYVLILVLALAGLNVMALLFCGTLLAAVIGFVLGRLDFFGALDLLGKGTLGMSETLIVALLAGGLFKTVQANGGIAWLIGKIARLVKGPRSCEAGVAFLTAAVNCFTANNTVAIVIAGPIAKACAERFHARPRRIASVLDTTSCIVQGLIPYGAQILIAIGAAKGLDLSIDPIALLKYFYYQPLLAVAVVVAIVLPNRQSRANSL
ncbi:MAG: Na+/H+ antiporter NhaC family protein [Kiritimatiellia bacterium]